MEDVHELARAMPHVTVETGPRGNAVYQVGQAGWTTAYDVRLTGADAVALTWYGMVWQHSGEDWPACELTLSTARPTVAASVPELDPWWVAPEPPMRPVMARAAPASRSGQRATAPVYLPSASPV